MTLKAAAHIEAMSAFALANFGGYDRPTLAQNESAFPPSPRTIEAGRDAVARSHLYPDPDWSLLRDAIARAGGYRISDGFISPLDLVEIGLLSSEEAQELHSAATRQPA